MPVFRMTHITLRGWLPVLPLCLEHCVVLTDNIKCLIQDKVDFIDFTTFIEQHPQVKISDCPIL